MMEYNSDKIQELDPIQHIRLRPDTYIGNTGLAGQRLLVKEIVDNSVDELEEVGQGGEISMVLFRDLETRNYYVAVRDTGRGVPPNSLIDVFTKAMTGGKFNQDSYKFSAGLNGVGSSVVMTLSQYFRAFSFRAGQLFDSGVLQHDDDKSKRVLKSYDYPDTARHGTTVVYSPDPDVFNERFEFISNVDEVVDYFAGMSLFIGFDLKLVIKDELIPKTLLTGDGLALNEYLDKAFNCKSVFDNKKFDSTKYLAKRYNLKNDPEYGIGINYSNKPGTLLLDGILNVTFDKPRVRSVCSVNNIVFADNESYHYTLIIAHLRKHIKILIDDIKIRKFFEKKYQIPIFVNMSVKFAGAKFSGMEKVSFKDTNFRNPYIAALNSLLPESIVEEIYSVIKPDLEEAYLLHASQELKVANNGILTQLNFPGSFTDCKSDNPDECELFIIEGLSAKQNEARDPNTQAFYAIRGKILNAITSENPEEISKAKERIIKDPLYSDIAKILNLGQNLNTDQLKFKNVFIMADADVHGYHISNILTANLNVLCPDLINGGHLNVVKAPLYKIRTSKSVPPMFARNHDDLIVGLSNRVFYNALEITIKKDGKEIFLDKDMFLGFIGWTYQIGDFITSVSKEYFVEPIVLEQLSLIADDLDNPNDKVLTTKLGIPIRYEAETGVLACSIGEDDLFIHLDGLKDVIRKEICPRMVDVIKGDIEIFVTTKRDKSLKNTKMSVVQLHGLLKKLQSSLDITKMKGLGSLSPKEKIATCMDPERRRVHKISKVGDLTKIFNLMGNDSKHRKALLKQ